MNKARRISLSSAVKMIERAISGLKEASAIISSASYDERDAFDNLPESLQESDRYSGMEDNADTLEDVVSDLENIISQIEEIIM